MGRGKITVPSQKSLGDKGKFFLAEIFELLLSELFWKCELIKVKI